MAFVVIALGAWTRLVDAGLGCPDWPGCYCFATIPMNPEEFELAKRILKQLNKESKIFLNLETGYGPSGVPHIGTFAEVLRTNMVKNAFSQISQIATKLITFSDDLDLLRKELLNLIQNLTRF